MTLSGTLSSARMIRIGLLLVATGLCMVSMPQVDASGQGQRKSLGALIEQVTGPNAVNCGRIDHTRDDEHALKKSLECAVDAAAAGKPFRVVGGHLGIDSDIGYGLLGKADGTMWEFDYDSAPCGAGGRCAARFNVRPCVAPTVGFDRGGQLSFVCKD